MLQTGATIQVAPVLYVFVFCGGSHFDPVLGTEELAHQEMIAAIVYQLTRNLTMEQIKQSGFDAYFVDHTTGIYPQSAAGVPFTAAALQCKGDAITDLMENLAADAAHWHNLQKTASRL